MIPTPGRGGWYGSLVLCCALTGCWSDLQGPTLSLNRDWRLRPGFHADWLRYGLPKDADTSTVFLPGRFRHDQARTQDGQETLTLQLELSGSELQGSLAKDQQFSVFWGLVAEQIELFVNQTSCAVASKAPPDRLVRSRHILSVCPVGMAIESDQVVRLTAVLRSHPE